MASTYSPSLRLELMATGDQSGTWGTTTNTNLGTLLEQSITGYLSVAQGDIADLTLTEVNGGTDQARNAVVRVTGALTATRNVVVQTAEKLYTIINATSGGFSIVAKTSAGTGISIPPGASMNVYSDGTNVVMGQNYWNGQIGGAVYLDAGATVGPVYDLFRDSVSPAAADILGQVLFNGRDNAANKQEYASIEAVIVDPVAATEDGQLDVYLTKAGARTKFLSLATAATAFTAAALYSFDAVVRPAANDGAALGASGTAWSDLFLASGAVVNWGAGDTTLTQSSGNLALTGSATDVVLDLSAANAGQIKFPATQNPSSNANTLDDYEEGTFTPTMEFATAGTSSWSYSQQDAVYTKIGNFIFEAIGLNATPTIGTGSGTISVRGNPFSRSSTGNPQSTMLLSTSTWTWPAGRTMVTGSVGAAFVQIAGSGTGVASSIFTASNMTSGSAHTVRTTVSCQAA